MEMKNKALLLGNAVMFPVMSIAQVANGAEKIIYNIENTNKIETLYNAKTIVLKKDQAKFRDEKTIRGDIEKLNKAFFSAKSREKQAEIRKHLKVLNTELDSALSNGSGDENNRIGEIGISLLENKEATRRMLEEGKLSKDEANNIFKKIDNQLGQLYASNDNLNSVQPIKIKQTTLNSEYTDILDTKKQVSRLLENRDITDEEASTINKKLNAQLEQEMNDNVTMSVITKSQRLQNKALSIPVSASTNAHSALRPNLDNVNLNVNTQNLSRSIATSMQQQSRSNNYPTWYQVVGEKALEATKVGARVVANVTKKGAQKTVEITKRHGPIVGGAIKRGAIKVYEQAKIYAPILGGHTKNFVTKAYAGAKYYAPKIGGAVKRGAIRVWGTIKTNAPIVNQWLIGVWTRISEAF